MKFLSALITKEVVQRVNTKLIEMDDDVVFQDPEKAEIDHEKTLSANLDSAKDAWEVSRQQIRSAVFAEKSENSENSWFERASVFGSGILSGARAMLDLYQAAHHAVEVGRKFLR